MKIYIARHGQNEDNVNCILNGHRDLPLTPLGRLQAQESARNIIEHQLHFDLVLCSPLIRAIETAEIITSLTNSPVPIEHPLLIERDFGMMTGKPIADIKKLCSPDILETDTVTYFLSPPGGESFPLLLVRANQLLEELWSIYQGKTTLLVTHGDIGKMIYAAYYSLPWEQVLTQFHFGNSELLQLSPNSAPEEAHLFNLEQFNH